MPTREHLLRGQRQNGGEQAIKVGGGDESAQERPCYGARCRRGFQNDRKPDIGQASSEEWSGAPARASNNRYDACADRRVDVHAEHQRQDRDDENAARDAENAAKRARAESRRKEPKSDRHFDGLSVLARIEHEDAERDE